MFGLTRTTYRPRNVRLDTLVRLRWLAVFGQAVAVLVVHFGLEFDVPILPCLAVIGLAAFLNIALQVGFPQTRWLEPERAAYLLASTSPNSRRFSISPAAWKIRFPSCCWDRC